MRNQIVVHCYSLMAKKKSIVLPQANRESSTHALIKGVVAAVVTTSRSEVCSLCCAPPSLEICAVKKTNSKPTKGKRRKCFFGGLRSKDFKVEPLSPTIYVRQKSINLLPLEFSLPLRDTMQGKGLWAQAIIRGRAACTRRFGMVEGTWNYDESKELQNWKDKITRYTQTIKEVGMIVFCQRKRQMHCL
ncbi:hypothetical protein CMV_025415 [Castanea mollissima]|uniref:Uncharacterized protein n=1 Tax=Castanea mollissima TaxID=60419 RepID=A0A8J4V511_9ROSI|nr:hypothetical protein CMV_025415 [Castanea mollissima]